MYLMCDQTEVRCEFIYLFIFCCLIYTDHFLKKTFILCYTSRLETFFDVFLKGLFESAAAEIGIGHISYYILKDFSHTWPVVWLLYNYLRT